MEPKAMAMQALRWLKKTNAKAVFACLLASLIAISSIWTLRLMSEVRKPRIIASNQGRNKTMLPLGILDLVASIEQTVVDSFPSVSPFAGAPAKQHRKPYIPKNRPVRDPKRPFFNRFQPRTNAPPVNVVKKPETVSLIYKGVFKRSDGVTMALIEDSKSGRSGFYGADADVFGMTLKGIEMETIEIIQEDGDPIELKRDLSAVFVEGNYVP